MRQSFQDSKQHLLQISVDLLDRMAEIQKLRLAIQSAEASKRRNRQSARRKIDPTIIAAPAEDELRA